MAIPTIDDVAQLAGVSIKTVSRVINNEPNVRPNTRGRVQAAIKELGYQPNFSARGLAGKRSYLIGLLYDAQMAESSYVINIQGGVLPSCRDEGYDLLIHPCYRQDSHLADEIATMIRKTSIDGVITAPPLSDMANVTSTLEEFGKPYVRLSPADYQHGSPCVYTDDFHAAVVMTQHLMSLGHRRIAFIAGHPDHRAVAFRLDGFKQAMQDAGLKLEKGAIIQGFNTFDSGIACGEKLLDLDWKPTAVFASNDHMATGVMRVAHQRGIRIPDDLSVAGFDDVPISSQIWPTLTTIRQPLHAMAEAATQLLLRQLRGRDAPIARAVMKTELMVRNSTGLARN